MGDFENDLRNAFEGAEFAPSERVWEGVEAGIKPKKKKGIFYMWQTYGVAATLLFLLTMGYLFRDSLFTNNTIDPQKKELTQNDQKKTPETNNEENTTSTDTEETEDPATLKPVEEPSAITSTDLQADVTNETSKEAETAPTDQTVDQPVTALVATNPVSAGESTDIIAADEQGTDLINTDLELLSLFELQESLAAIRGRWELENLIGPMEIAYDSAESIDESTVARQTSLNGILGSGSFNPNSSLADAVRASSELSFNDPRSNADQIVQSGDESQLGSLSIGFGVGKQLGRKWMFKTGLRYSQYRFASTSNAYSVEDGQSLPVYSRLSIMSNEVFYAGEYEITNTIHSISVPVQFGFRVLNFNRFSTWVNMGAGADYFMSYKVKGELNFLEPRKVDFGDSNFLNRFNVNVLTGLELAYKLNDKFALSGEIFFRQYLPLGASDSAYEATPSFFGFGLGVNYYLKKKK